MLLHRVRGTKVTGGSDICLSAHILSSHGLEPALWEAYCTSILHQGRIKRDLRLASYRAYLLVYIARAVAVTSRLIECGNIF